jgi:hypothetical protein
MAVRFQGGKAVSAGPSPQEQLAHIQRVRDELSKVGVSLNKMSADIVALKRISTNTSAIRRGDVEVFEDILTKAKGEIEGLMNFARRMSNI